MRPAFALASLLLAACRTADFGSSVDETRRALKIPALSIAIVRDGEIVEARGFGTATADTLYPIGSITKTFTATLMLQLAAEGRLDLQQPVARFVDWEVAPDIRIRHVLSHTSESTPPGTRFAYSSRFNWLDNVVEAATKEKFRALMRERVLGPAQLTRTIMGEDGVIPDGMAAPHRSDGTPSKHPPMELHSSSGLTSTVVDLARYSIALDAGRLLDDASLNRAYTPAAPALPYGLGWYTQIVGGERVVWHTSWWPDAYSGLLVKVPSRRLTLVLLANSDALVAPQRGASNVMLYPIANDFLRKHLGVKEGDTPISDEDRLRVFGDIEAGKRLLEAYPDDVHIRFDVAMAYGNVRPTLRINGPRAAEAVALLQPLLASTRPMPKWMEAWAAYLVAEQIAASDPSRARALAQRAPATKVDTDGLQGRVAALLRSAGF